MKCKKCDNIGTVVLRRKDHYCENCFLLNINHKFRACIGKNRALPPKENVLVCLSGGTSSTALLDMIHQGISLSSHKKLRISPVFLHLTDDDNKESSQIAGSIINQCKEYNFLVYVVHISNYMQEHIDLPEAYIVTRSDNKMEFAAMLNSMPDTVKKDYILKIRRSLAIRIAEQLNCNYIFTAESTATLAVSLLSNLTVGRGAQIQDDVSFCDARHDKVKILRPMKDISMEELQCYMKIKKLSPADQYISKDNSLHSVIETFVTELQDSFQATISTVCKTADKIGTCSNDVGIQKCVICECDLKMKNTKLTALEATNFSRIVSLEIPSSSADKSIVSLEQLTDEKSMFPFINEHLCYSCSRNYLEMDHLKLPCHVREILKS